MFQLQFSLREPRSTIETGCKGSMKNISNGFVIGNVLRNYRVYWWLQGQNFYLPTIINRTKGPDDTKETAPDHVVIAISP